MDSRLSEMEADFFQGRFEAALTCAEQLLQTLDPEEDDDAETLYKVFRKGLGSGQSRAFADLLTRRGVDCSIRWPGKGGLAVLYAGCDCNDPTVFASLERLGMDPVLPDRAGNTVLHVFASMERSPWTKQRETEMAELVRSRAEVSGWMEPNAYGATPLQLAVFNNHDALLEALLAAGVDPDLSGTAMREGFGHAIDFNGLTALQLACWMGNQGAAAALLDAGASDSLGDHHGRTAAHYAVAVPNQHGCPEYFSGIPGQERVLERKRAILQRLGTFDTPDDRGASPLLDGLTGFRYDAGGFTAPLVERGALVDRADNRGCTPLMAAAEHGHQQALKTLLAAGAQPNARGVSGATALLLAVRERNEKAARLLIKKGADASLADDSGLTPMDLAAQQGMDAVLELLL